MTDFEDISPMKKQTLDEYIDLDNVQIIAPIKSQLIKKKLNVILTQLSFLFNIKTIVNIN